MTLGFGVRVLQYMLNVTHRLSAKCKCTLAQVVRTRETDKPCGPLPKRADGPAEILNGAAETRIPTLEKWSHGHLHLVLQTWRRDGLETDSR
jgi:hypothetical protein